MIFYREIYPKVRDYEWNKQQRKPSHSSLKFDSKLSLYALKKSSSVDPIDGPIDIFKSNRLIDQKKLFDEFDELFEKNNRKVDDKKDIAEEEEEKIPPKSPTLAFRRLNELKKNPSSSFSISTDESDDKIELKLINATTATATKATVPDFNLKPPLPPLSSPPKRDMTATSKPKIISEQIKKNTQKKILYYNDELELQEMIMKRMSTSDGNGNEVAKPNVISSSNESKCNRKHPSSLSVSSSQQVIAAAHSSSTKSNSLRIFSNEGIFVFNL